VINDAIFIKPKLYGVLYEDGESVVIKGVGSDRPSYNDLVLMF
jgi:hypothetical protein